MRRLRILACVTALATTASLTVGLLHVLEVIPSEQEDWIPLGVYPFLALALLAPTVVGLLIALQLPRNLIAWILLLGAFLPSFQLSAEQTVGAAWSYQSERATLPLLFAWPVAVAFVFPNGRLLSRRWRWVAGAAAVSFGLTIALKMFDPTPFEPPNEDIRNPVLGNSFGELVIDAGLWIPFAIGLLASLFAAALAVVVRFRRSVGVERLQMLWLVWAVALIPLAIGYDTLANFLLGGGGTTSFILLMFALVAVVAAIGIAVVRYRLYAIERLINRTLVYVSLTLLLLGVYTGCHRRTRGSRRWRFDLGGRRRDARRRPCLPSDARANPGPRRPPLSPCALRGRASRPRVRRRRARWSARTRGDRRGPGRGAR